MVMEGAGEVRWGVKGGGMTMKGDGEVRWRVKGKGEAVMVR